MVKSDSKIHKNIDLYELAGNGERMPTRFPFPAYPLEEKCKFFSGIRTAFLYTPADHTL